LPPPAVKLVPFSPQYLRLDEPLPFGVRDEDGRLLLGAGQTIATREQLAGLQAQRLFAEESESAEWQRRLAAAVDAALRQGATLREVAEVRPEQPTRPTAAAELPLAEQWDELVVQLDAALRDVRPGGDWLARLLGVHARARRLGERRFDASLYHFIYTAAHSTEKYSSHHALLTLLVAEQAARLLEWPAAQVDALGRASLTMNVAMVRLQDMLAQTDHKPTPEMRAQIDGHAEAGARMLAEGGLKDALACAVVRLHHDASEATQALQALPTERRLARLLRRVDIFCAGAGRARGLPGHRRRARRDRRRAAQGRGPVPAGQLRRAGQRRGRHRARARPARQPAVRGLAGLAQRRAAGRAGAARHDRAALCRQGCGAAGQGQGAPAARAAARHALTRLLAAG
jgi:hypothetical protein